MLGRMRRGRHVRAGLFLLLGLLLTRDSSRMSQPSSTSTPSDSAKRESASKRALATKRYTVIGYAFNGVLALGAAFVALWLAFVLDNSVKDKRDCRAQLSEAEGATRSLDAPQNRADTNGALPLPVDRSETPAEGVVEPDFRFGTDRGAFVRTWAFTISRPMPSEDVRMFVPFGAIKHESGRQLPARHIAAKVGTGAPGPGLVAASICIDPLVGGNEILPGAYSGTAFVGVGNDVTPLPLSATVQDDSRWWVVLAAIVGAGAALVVKVVADVQTVGLPGGADEGRAIQNLASPRFTVAIGAACVVSVYSFQTIYNDDPAFVATFGNVWRITAETFAGTLAAKAVTDLARPGAKGTDEAGARGDTDRAAADPSKDGAAAPAKPEAPVRTAERERQATS
jgi:hypothetical protein